MILKIMAFVEGSHDSGVERKYLEKMVQKEMVWMYEEKEQKKKETERAEVEGTADEMQPIMRVI